MLAKLACLEGEGGAPSESYCGFLKSLQYLNKITDK